MDLVVSVKVLRKEFMRDGGGPLFFLPVREIRRSYLQHCTHLGRTIYEICTGLLPICYRFLTTKSIRFSRLQLSYTGECQQSKATDCKSIPGKVACDTCKGTNKTSDQKSLHAELEDYKCGTPWLLHRWKVYIQTPCRDGDVKTSTVFPGRMHRHGHAIKCKRIR